MDATINLNQHVVIQLLPAGRAIIDREQAWADFTPAENGCHTALLWAVMSLFGSRLYHGLPTTEMPFAPTMTVLG